MDEREVYNLKPLKLVVLGLIISSISTIFLVKMDYSIMVVIINVVRIIGWLIVVLGLRKVRGYSLFNKCYKVACCLFVFAILGISIFLIPIVIAFFYYLFKSVEEIALQLEENKLAKITDKIWMISAWTVILDCFVVPIFAGLFSVQGMIMSIAIIVPSIISLIMCIFIYKAAKILDGREIVVLLEQKEKA